MRHEDGGAKQYYSEPMSEETKFNTFQFHNKREVAVVCQGNDELRHSKYIYICKCMGIF